MFLKENNEAARFSGRALLQKQDGVSVGKQQDYRIYALTEFAELKNCAKTSQALMVRKSACCETLFFRF